MNNSQKTPVLIFGYDRPEHLNNLLMSLRDNPEIKETVGYLYIDGASDKTDKEKHKETIKIAKKDWGFREQHLVLRNKNYGCRDNIIEGISEIIKNKKKLIILEDDLVVSKYFLDYMNKALNIYEGNKDIWHINSWSHPKLSYFKSRTAISPTISPWGWATWEDRWDKFIDGNYHNQNLISNTSPENIRKFNFSNLYDWENIIIQSLKNNASIWDAYWYQAIYVNNGYSIFPSISHSQNYGFDGTGVHCGINDEFKTRLTTHKTKHFTQKRSTNQLYHFSYKLFYRRNKLVDYYNYHKFKFSSFDGFLTYIKTKMFR